MNHLDQVLQQIKYYRNGDLSLHALVGDLEFLHDSMVDQNESFKRTMFEKIGDLEQVNAVMLDRGTELDETGQAIVDKALDDLVALVGEAKRA